MTHLFTVKLFSQLKNTDLACLSAQDAIKSLLSYDALSHLTRYTLWELDIEDNSQAQAIEKIRTILDTSYYLINPNKEAYFLAHLPKPDPDSSSLLFFVKVYDPKMVAQKNISEKIVRKTGIPIQSVRKYTLWQLVVLSQGKPSASIQKELEERVVLSTSTTQGILANSVYEKYQFLTPAEL